MNSGTPGNSSLTQILTPRDLAATLFRKPQLMIGSFAVVLLATMAFALLSARYESHFKVLLRRGRFDPVASAQPAGAMDVSRPAISEEELNSEVELLRDEDLLKQVVTMAGLIPSNGPAENRQPEIEHAARKLGRRLDVEALKKSNLIQGSYMNKHTNLQRPSGEIQFFDRQTEESAKRLHHSEAEIVNFTRARGVVSAAMEREIALQRLGDAEGANRQMDQAGVE